MKLWVFFLSGLLLIGLGLTQIVVDVQMPVNQYYNHANGHTPRIYGDKVGAPNEVYNVWVSRVNDDSTVMFPLCESYGGLLHGTWKYDSHHVVFECYKWYLVQLENNIIVQLVERMEL